jgi:phosphate transport system substrate-binding protein
MKRFIHLFAPLSMGVLISCHPLSDRDTEKNTAILENINKGNFKVYAEKHTDYLFNQIIDVYESSFPEAKVDVRYMEEKAVLNALLMDSVRIILLQRELLPQELDKIQKAFDTKPIQSNFAYDAIVLASGRNASPQTIPLDVLKQLIETGSERIVSLEEYAHLYALLMRMLEIKSSKKALSTVANLEDLKTLLEKDTSRLALLPFSLVSDEDDPKAKAVRKMFSWAGITSKNGGKTDTVFPSQSSIFTNEWPLVKPYNILYCNVARKDGYGVVQFVHNRQTAKLILKAGLVPSVMPERKVQIQD